MFFKLLNNSVVLAYKNFGAVAVSNIVWLLAVVPLAGLMWLYLNLYLSPGIWFILSVIVFSVLVNPVTVGVMAVADRLTKNDYSVRWRDIFELTKKYYVRSAVMTFIVFLIYLIIFFNTVFYFSNTIKIFPRELNILLGVLWLWGGIFIMAVQMYFWPLFVMQNTSMLDLVRVSFLLLWANLEKSFVVMLVLALLIFLCVITGIGGLVFLITLPSIYLILYIEQVTQITAEKIKRVLK
ncbi:MAG: hypothetical protein WC955_05235 [Elusimicrobiota bacterium]